MSASTSVTPSKSLSPSPSTSPRPSPSGIFAFIRPPLVTPSKPELISKTDSSFSLTWTCNSTTDPLTKAVDVTNITTAAGLAKLTLGLYRINVVGDTEEPGLNTLDPRYSALHPVLGLYAAMGVNATLPLYGLPPNNSLQVYLRKPVKFIQVQTQHAYPGQKIDPTAWELAASLDYSAVTAEIENLDAGTGYHVRVCTANTEGTGACSLPALYLTADVPPQPAPVQLSVAYARGLEVIVSKPQAINGAPVTLMELEMSPKYTGPWTKVEYDMAMAKKIVRGLEPGVTYFFRSRAWNRIGPSKYSVPASFDTLALVPAAIKDLKIGNQLVDAATSTVSVELHWSAPDPRGRPITDYEVHKSFGFNADDASFLLHELTEATNSTVRGLLPGKMYHFRVRALNLVGAGNWSNIEEMIASPAVTTPPGDITLVSSTPRSLEIQFGVPSDFHGAPPEHYLVQMQHTPDPPQLGPDGKPVVYWNDVYRGPETHVTLGAPYVSPAHTYRLRVKAENLVGSSKPSREAVFSTAVTAPDAPAPPNATEVTTSSLRVQWRAPAANGAPILSYRLKVGKQADVVRYQAALKANATANETSSLVPQMLLGVEVGGEGLRSILSRNGGGRSRVTGMPCKAVPGSVYDYPIPEEFRTPDIIPGTQRVYPEPEDDAPQDSPPAAANRTLSPPAAAARAANTSASAQPAAGNDGFWIAYEGNGTDAFIDSLLPGTAYVFSLQAASAIGVSSEGEFGVIATLPDVPDRPRSPILETRGRNYVVFSWVAAPERGTAVTGYVVQMSTGAKDRFGNVIYQNICTREFPPTYDVARNYTTWVPPVFLTSTDLGIRDACRRPSESGDGADGGSGKPRRLSCCVDGLERDKPYLIRVAATSRLGLSDFSSPAKLSTRGDAPSTPAPPQLVAATPSSISVAWTIPPTGTDDPARLTFTLAMAGAGQDERVVYDGPSRNVTVSGLQPNTTYKFRVDAKNRNGRSQPSEYTPGRTCLPGEAACGPMTRAAKMANLLQEVVVEDASELAREDALMQAQLAEDARLRAVAGRLNTPRPHLHPTVPRQPSVVNLRKQSRPQL